MLQKFKNISIGVRLGMGFSFILLLFTVVGLFIINRMALLSDLTNMMYKHPLTVSNAALRVDSNIVRIQRSMQDVNLAKSNAQLAEAAQIIDKYEKEVHKDFDIIAERFLGDPKMYKDARRTFREWKLIRNEIIALVSRGEKNEAEAITKGKVAHHVAKLNSTVLALNDFARNKARDFLDETLNTRTKTLNMAYILVIVTILAGIIFVTFLTLSITRPLANLMGAVLEISMGNLDKRISVQSDDEIGQYARAFNGMAVKLNESYKNLEEKVHNRTGALDNANKELKKEIAEHLRTEEQLKLNAQALENMLEGVNIIRASDKTFIYVNPAFEKMFGYERGEMPGMPVTVLNAPTDKSSEDTAAEIMSVLNKEGVWEGELINIKKDGTSFPTHAKVSSFEHSIHGTLWITIQEDISERKQAEDKIKASLKEKTVLLQEIHHRVKNNLQIITSLLNMQVTSLQEPQIIRQFKIIEGRVKSMALIHEQLYQSRDLAEIDFADYAPKLIESLFQSYQVKPGGIKLNTDIDSVPLNINTAIPCGLIINELVSNCLSHAFRDRETGEIQVKFKSNNDPGVTLTVSDDGVGFPGDIDMENPGTLGLKIITGLTKQVHGTMDFYSNKETGTTFKITFKIK